MPKRIQSPSSINTFNQCPRRYFYQYILKLPTKPSIHLVRGSIVHEALEKFFKINLGSLDKKDYKFGFRSYLTANLLKSWRENKHRFEAIGISNSELESYLIDSQLMLNNFIELFSKKFNEKLSLGLDFEKAFHVLAPTVEEEIRDEALQVRGFIDAIHTDNDEIVIMDYKTSNKDEITPEYRLQLGIYALLYERKFKDMPSKVGINFLKFGEQFIDVTHDLLKEAEIEILKVHKCTESSRIDDYPKKPSALCKWSSGQCDFYDECGKEGHS